MNIRLWCRYIWLISFSSVCISLCIKGFFASVLIACPLCTANDRVLSCAHAWYYTSTINTLVHSAKLNGHGVWVPPIKNRYFLKHRVPDRQKSRIQVLRINNIANMLFNYCPHRSCGFQVMTASIFLCVNVHILMSFFFFVSSKMMCIF